MTVHEFPDGGIDARYLTAKISVDDRALNRHVLSELINLMPVGAPRVMEVGAGLGTMMARLLDWGVLTTGDYTLVDVDHELLGESRRWLQDWASARGVRVESTPDGLHVGGVRVRLVHAELGRYLQGDSAVPADLLIANAVLDLLDLSTVLPGLLRQLRPGGIYWFTINYDGETIFQPDHPSDDIVLHAYHRDMDERVRYGRPAGESRTGRHLFDHLRAVGAPVIAAGSSDWVVHPNADGGYPADEAYFVACILRTIREAVAGRVEAAELTAWDAARARQLAKGELTYIAHQLDVLGTVPVR